MSDSYCDLCDADPCYCGQHGKLTPIARTAATTRSAPRGLDEPIREFVLTSYEEGVLDNWGGWLARIMERFEIANRSVARNAWNRVSNQFQRDWVLIDDPGGEAGPLRSPRHYPNARRLPLPDAIAAVEELIVSGRWSVGDKGLRLWQVRRLIENSVYINIWDALHDMNSRDYLVTTTSPSGSKTMFWYVRESAT
ncbi:hypothetical protein [Nocardioides currus]|uniref:Uncharacterized protein n=1 Tax=Nocardioides currus TaxID=2133958 RepID=A0A2R7YRD0_9ACTN|nr:hypothetical protein [Nocardioides currus]PUA78942.1 hypothetical protein C7S10_21815 [Nocardioides currus]